jgi:hypothetical protein
MTPQKRKLPPLPPDRDETDKEIITYLLDKYVEDLVQSGEDFDIAKEVDTFFRLLDQTYPIALKDYVNAYIAQHLKVLMTGVVGRLRRAARKRTSIEHGRQGTPSGNAYKSFSGVGENRFRQVAHMTLVDLQFVSHRYRTTAESSQKAAEFHERLAARFQSGDDMSKVADLWTEAEVNAISEDIFGVVTP